MADTAVGHPVVGAAVIIVLPALVAPVRQVRGACRRPAVLVLSLALAGRFDPKGAQFQFVENHPWIPSFGTGYILGLTASRWRWWCSPPCWCRYC